MHSLKAPERLATKDAPTTLALRVPDVAAAAIGISPDSFMRHVAPEVELVRIGNRDGRAMTVVAVEEIMRFLREHGRRLA